MAGPIPEIVEASELIAAALRIIAERRTISVLVSGGYGYWQISQALKFAIGLGYLMDKDGLLTLTDSGLGYLRRRTEQSRKFALRPKDEMRIATMGIDAPYLPSRRTLELVKDRISN